MPNSSADPSASPSPVVHELADVLVELSFVVQSILSEEADRQGVTLAQLRLLAILEDRTIGMARLATLLELGRPSASGLVDRAERRGLVHRTHPAEDRRTAIVTVTPEGRRIITAARADVRTMINDLSTSLPEDRQGGLASSGRTFLTAYDLLRRNAHEDRVDEGSPH